MEKMRKVNELAAELKKHRSILDTDDTVKKAQELVLDGDSPLVLPEERKAVPEGKEPSEAEILIKESNKAIKEQLDLLSKGLLQLNEEFKDFKKDTVEKLEKIKQIALSTPPTKPEPTKDDMPAKPEDAQKSQSPGTEEKKVGFTPEDVAVDKVFYFGKK